MGFARLKQVPLITPVPKSGKAKLIIVNAIFGLLDVSFIRWLL